MDVRIPCRGIDSSSYRTVEKCLLRKGSLEFLIRTCPALRGILSRPACLGGLSRRLEFPNRSGAELYSIGDPDDAQELSESLWGAVELSRRTLALGSRRGFLEILSLRAESANRSVHREAFKFSGPAIRLLRCLHSFPGPGTWKLQVSPYNFLGTDGGYENGETGRGVTYRTVKECSDRVAWMLLQEAFVPSSGARKSKPL